MSSWTSYPHIYALGHRALADLLKDDVVVQEKVDGSQFSFGLFRETDPSGTSVTNLRVRSRGAEMIADAPEKMFASAVEAVKQRLGMLREGWTYRGEVLAKPKHNVLVYDRVPKGNVILFDIAVGLEEYLSPEQVREEAERLGLEAVPTLYKGRVENAEQIRGLLDTVSVLGGQKVEGVVLKNYVRFGRDSKPLMGKFVSEAFKEIHDKTWRQDNPNVGDIIQILRSKFTTPARWAKAVQHLREGGALEGSPRDIGLLMKEVPQDILVECKGEILDLLWKWAWPFVRRGVVQGLPEWYKEQLLRAQFDGPVEAMPCADVPADVPEGVDPNPNADVENIGRTMKDLE